MAANGIDLGYGSAVRVQQDTIDLANDDAKNLYRNIEQRTRGHHINAGNYTAEAMAARQRGKAALTQSFFSAASSVLGGISQAVSMKAKMGTSH
jgi:hypothetical protein